MMKSVWFSVLYSLGACIFLLLGYLGRRNLLDKNPCTMTYSATGSRQVAMNKTMIGYNLWRVDYPQKGILNDQPILFIPGSGGRIAQARSFSSSLHNDGTFQYFVAHLGNEWSALHASTVIRQATFINEAITAIKGIYKDEGKRFPGIILLAHSVGGIVARTSLLLSNQPKGCIVNAIVMLDSPNGYPAYSPDASMDVLYKHVNNAWRQSYLNESSICRSQMKKHVAKGSIDWNIECPKCTSKTMLISVTGGEIDELVAPSHTQLDPISPRPRNITHSILLQQKKKEKDGGGLLQYVNPLFYVRVISSFVTLISPYLGETSVNGTLGLNGSENGINTSNLTDGNCSNDNIVADANHENTSSTEDDKPKFVHPLGSWATVTYEKWQEDMTPFITPKHLSIRTSQLPNVGFPVDHKAIVWCYEVVDAVSSVLKLLSTSSSLSSWDVDSHLRSYVNKNKKRKIPSDQNDAQQSSTDYNERDHDLYANVIDPVMELVHRNDSLSAWIAAAHTDRMHIISSLNFNPLLAMATQYYTSHIGSILIAYVSIGCLALAAPSLRDITGHTLSSLRSVVRGREEYLLPPLTDSSVHNFATLFGMDIIMPTISANYEAAIVSSSSSPSLQSICSMGGALISLFVLGKILFDFYYSTLSEMLVNYGGYLEFFLSFGIAATIRFCLIMYINFLRWSFFGILSFVTLVARWTVWCKPIREFFEGIFEKPIKVFRSMITVRSVFITYILIIVGILSYLWVYKLENTKKLTVPIEDSFYFSIIAVYVSFWAAVASIVFVFIFPPTTTVEKVEDINQQIAKARTDGNIELVKELKRKKNKIDSTPKVDEKEVKECSRLHSHQMNSLILLYLPTVLYASSTFMFAQSMISDGGSTFATLNVILANLGPDMMTYAVCLFAISLHLIIARIEFKLQIPMEWLEEICGPDSMAFPLQVALKNDTVGKCVHEDGGKYAIYQEIDENKLTKIGNGIHMGTSYIVSSCNCALDYSLKSVDQWCSFCRCPFCGDKKNALAKDRDNKSWQQRQERYRKLVHLIPGLGNFDKQSGFSSSAALVVGLFFLASFNMIYTYQHLYRLVYSTAMVAALNLCCIWFNRT